MSSVWDEHASWWKDTFATDDPEYQHQIIPAVVDQVRSGWSVVDIGCGEGQLARAALRNGAAAVVAVERSEAMLQLAMETDHSKGITWVRGDFTALPLASGQFDLATVGLVFEHVEDWKAAADELSRVLKPGGTALVFLNHPMFQTPGSGWIDDQILEEQYWRVGPYLRCVTTSEEVEPGVRIDFAHRPLSEYVNYFGSAGLGLVEMNEPAPPPEFLAQEAGMEGAEAIPRLLFLRLQKS